MTANESGKRYGSGAGESGGEAAYPEFYCCGKFCHGLCHGPGAYWNGDRILTQSGGGECESGSASGSESGMRRGIGTGSDLEAFVLW